MQLEEVLEKLCYKDARNPDFMLGYEDEEVPEPRNGCFCDNCFYGRDALAMEILRLRSEIESLEFNNKLGDIWDA